MRLSIFQKYARLNITHVVFGQKDMFLYIMSYLDAEDLHYAVQVSFYW